MNKPYSSFVSRSFSTLLQRTRSMIISATTRKCIYLGSFELRFLALLCWKGPLDHVLAHVVVLGQVEKLADLGGTLGSQTTRDGGIGEAGNVVVSFLHNNHRNDGKISIDNATTNRLAFTFTCTALTVARVAFAQEKTHTKSGKDTLFHGETLLVVSTSNTENVTGPFVTKGGSINFLAHTFLIKGTNLK